MCLEARPCGGQVVKDLDYLADNVSCNRLSELGRAVNDKERCETEARQKFQGLESRETGAPSVRINLATPKLWQQLALPAVL